MSSPSEGLRFGLFSSVGGSIPAVRTETDADAALACEFLAGRAVLKDHELLGGVQFAVGVHDRRRVAQWWRSG